MQQVLRVLCNLSLWHVNDGRSHELADNAAIVAQCGSTLTQ